MSAPSGSSGAACRLRRMVAGDLARVLELEQSLFPADAWYESTFREELSRPGRHYLVAEPDTGEPELLGYAGLSTNPPQGDVQTMAVAPPHWGNGIGSTLLESLIQEAGRRGATEMFLEVRADNDRARRLYRRFGFLEMGVRRGYYNDGVDAVVMHRSAQATAKEYDRG